jgi:hypothetical protein
MEAVMAKRVSESTVPGDIPDKDLPRYIAQAARLFEAGTMKDQYDPEILPSLVSGLDLLVELFGRRGHIETCNRLLALRVALGNIIGGYEPPLFSVARKPGRQKTHPAIRGIQACVCHAIDKLEFEGMSVKEAVNLAAKRPELAKLLRPGADIHTSIMKWRTHITDDEKSKWIGVTKDDKALTGNEMLDLAAGMAHDSKYPA